MSFAGIEDFLEILPYQDFFAISQKLRFTNQCIPLPLNLTQNTVITILIQKNDTFPQALARALLIFSTVTPKNGKSTRNRRGPVPGAFPLF